MRKLATFTAAAALVAVFGFTGTASADPWADDAIAFTPGTGGGANPTAAEDAPDGTTVTLGDNGNIVLNFTDNVCLDDGTATEDFTVTELVDNLPESYSVAIGFQGEALTPLAAGGLGITDFDTEGVAAFNQISITDDGEQLFANGSDIDAVTCANSFDLGTDQIEKTNTGSTDIIIQAKFATSNGQQFFSFEIKITNADGEDLSDIVFEDVLPAEFDLDPVAEDLADGGGIDACASGDGVCDGVRVITDDSGTCTATGAEGGAKGKGNGNQKLAPDIVTITDTASDTGEICEVEVFAQTDNDHPGRGNALFTPTECNETTFIFLNDGVQVIDTSGAEDLVLFRDDDQLELSCVAPTF